VTGITRIGPSYLESFRLWYIIGLRGSIVVLGGSRHRQVGERGGSLRLMLRRFDLLGLFFDLFDLEETIDCLSTLWN
jgi:hypothetical protein